MVGFGFGSGLGLEPHPTPTPTPSPTLARCAMAPPRGQCWDRNTNKGSGCTQTHMSPDGVVFPRALNYSSVAGMEVRVRARVKVGFRAQP